MGIHDLDFVLAPVAHDPIDFRQGLGNVLAIPLVRDRQAFLRVNVIKRDRALAGLSGGRHVIGVQTQGSGKRDDAKKYA